MNTLEDYKSLSEADQTELLQYILSTQLLILRRLDFLEGHITKKEESSHWETTKDMIEKIPSNIERINEYLSAPDDVKGKLRF